jgi:hypothetical protein
MYARHAAKRALVTALFAIFVCMGALVVLFPIGCGDETEFFEPASDTNVGDGLTVTGVARFEDDTPAAGVVVTLEGVEDGLTASVSGLRAAIVNARDGEKPVGPIDVLATLSALDTDVRATVTDKNGRFNRDNIRSKAKPTITSRAFSILICRA